jgi:hypothetical protein
MSCVETYVATPAPKTERAYEARIALFCAVNSFSMRASLGPEKLYTESLVRDFFREKRLSDGPWDISFRNNGF